ncbi:MAG: DUF2723 domain-containing protein [Bacteroidales bacterium]|nr:DUF2723 domain-containing protein [Bacteroidales bacterium]
MKDYRFYNNLLGWVSFVLAAITYLLTIEPTVSLWDCGEFITTGSKLEVGHPPGAPLFMLLGRFFSIFAGSPGQIAMMMNVISALASAFTILFLFWTITRLARKLIQDGEFSTGKQIAVLSAGLIGALAYAFSDTFWFSAVEAEVYALSSLLTAVVFWLILRWEDEADAPFANRWLILIAYVMGLSIGVHLLNLLAIPALVFVFYFRKFTVSRKGIIYASILAILILGIIQYGIIPGVVSLAASFELLFVNSFGLPYNSGVIFYGLVIIGGLVYGLYYTHQKAKFLLHQILLSLVVMLIGYSSYSVIVIRSYANLPLDENNPENVFSLLSYLNRDQYGHGPLLYGEQYSAPILGTEEDLVSYRKVNGKYVKYPVREKSIFDDRFKTIFPRMYSRQQSHINAYKSWGDIEGKTISSTNMRGERENLVMPTFGENLRFFFKYQLNHMYIRYLMWNFAGRQNDQQGFGNTMDGNWISGIPFIDRFLIGSQDKMPAHMKNDPSRNTYFLLPFILGIAGLSYQYARSKKSFTVVGLLFFFTGIAIVLYLNQTPYQPRERDYAYAGSFYAFAIWIGLGILWMYEIAKRWLSDHLAALVSGGLFLILVPGIMLAQNYDDHNRSGRYYARDLARNFLNSCEKNALIFTYGDNDTFPLWYIQEVEGYRTDVRVVNMSLLSTDWYTNQLRNQYYDSQPVKMSFTPEKIEQGTRDQILIIDQVKEYKNVKDLLKWVSSDDARTLYRINQDVSIHYLPGKRLQLPVDKAKVLANGTVQPEDAALIEDYVQWNMKPSSIIKNEMMVLDILAENEWERPIYFAISAPSDSYLNLDEYLQLEGFAYRLVPIKTVNQDNSTGRVNKKVLYQNIMNEFTWGNVSNPDVWVDEYTRRQIGITDARTVFARLALEYIRDNEYTKAIEVLDRSIKELPDSQVPFDQRMLSYVKAYYLCNAPEKANALAETILARYEAENAYFESLKAPYFNYTEQDRRLAGFMISTIKDLQKSYQK